MIKLKKNFPLLLILIALIFIGSCSKNPTYDVNTGDLDMVYTNYKAGTDFTDYKTFTIPDSLDYSDEATESEIEEMQGFYEEIKQLVVENMEARNFTYVEVDTNDVPDMGYTITIISRTNYVYSWGYYPWSWWGGWWGYPWYGYPGYYYYYPWTTYIGSYEDGALILDLSDLKNVDTTNAKPDVIWSSLTGGVSSGSAESNLNRLFPLINQAFKQSPYLETNP